ncbi:MAG: DUF4328 domain-containing protein [Paracoccaceae bacterium]
MSDAAKNKVIQLKPIATLGNWCVRLLYTLIFLKLVYFVTTLNAYRQGVMNAPAPGFDPVDAYIQAYDQAYDFAADLALLPGLAYVVVFIVGITLNLFWIVRSTHNAEAIDPKPGRIKKWMALLYNFIPFVNWWMPFKSVTQVWHSSLGNNDPLNARAPTFFWVWWICWVIKSVLSIQSFRLALRDGPQSHLAVLQMDLFSAPFGVVSVYVFARIIRRITDAQKEALDSKVLLGALA